METATLPHLAAQPGLRGHSYDDEAALTHRFRVDKKTPSGWLAQKSRREYADALDLFADFVTNEVPVFEDEHGERHTLLPGLTTPSLPGLTPVRSVFRIVDQHDGDKVVR